MIAEHNLPDDQYPEPEIKSGDQTRFSAEKPLFESSAYPSQPAAVTAPPSTRWYQKPLVLVAMAFAALMLLLVVLLIMLKPAKLMIEEPLPSSSPVISPVTDPLREKILQLRKELESADPSRQELPFPPVNLELRLDDT
jgi:hypothetical protein